MVSLTIHHSLLSPDSLLAWLQQRYDLGEGVKRCRLIRMGLNDTYLIDGSDPPYIVRVYRAAWRSLAEVSAELEILRYLKSQTVPVAGPVADRAGQWVQDFAAPEGQRAVVVFDYIDGQALALDAKQAWRYGQALAKLHEVTKDFCFASPRFHLDERHLLDEPLAAIATAFGHHAEQNGHINALAIQARTVLQTLPKIAPFYGFCHGDHFGNVLHTRQDQLAFIDFDCCGVGWRIYDVVQFWWAIRLKMPAWRETLLAPEEALWQAFCQGYDSVRPLTLAERQALPAMFIIRTLWGLALQPQNERHWGIEQHEAIWWQNYALLAGF